ncbi:hypothetical protein [Persicobacter diffluens]|uniref:Uncharacterized protein n=1 Tax=Persicobacter diffluens TaxID=981 RepID=A0AAN4W6J4_9BACT|nr:hypothetical protein PEDI_55520 [Persicobacter diffluens]
MVFFNILWLHFLSIGVNPQISPDDCFTFESYYPSSDNGYYVLSFKDEEGKDIVVYSDIKIPPAGKKLMEGQCYELDLEPVDDAVVLPKGYIGHPLIISGARKGFIALNLVGLFFVDQ